jgi:hypothetical protein
MPGPYFAKLVLDDGYETLDTADDVPAFEIEHRDYWGSGQLPKPVTQGVVLQRAHWSSQRAEGDDGGGDWATGLSADAGSSADQTTRQP